MPQGETSTRACFLGGFEPYGSCEEPPKPDEYSKRRDAAEVLIRTGKSKKCKWLELPKRMTEANQTGQTVSSNNETADSYETKITELKVVLAIGILAGMLALVQFWNSRPGVNLLWQYPPDIHNVVSLQSNSFILALITFGGYLELLILGVGFESFTKFTWLSKGLRTLSDYVFLGGGFLIVLTAIFTLARYLE